MQRNLALACEFGARLLSALSAVASDALASAEISIEVSGLVPSPSAFQSPLASLLDPSSASAPSKEVVRICKLSCRVVDEFEGH